jgi:type IV pilus assembly protein PilO
VSPRERNIAIAGAVVVLVVLAVFYVLLLGPLLANLGEQAEIRDEKEARLDEIEARVAELEEVRRNSPELQRQLLELNKRIPEQPEVETFVVQVEEVAEEAGVTGTEFTRGDPEPPEGGGDFTVQPITMTFEGTYEELLAFLTGLDDLVRLVAVNEMTYEIAGEGTTAAPEIEQNLLVEIDAEIYFQPAGVPDGTDPIAPEPPETTTGTDPEEDEATEGG